MSVSCRVRECRASSAVYIGPDVPGVSMQQALCRQHLAAWKTLWLELPLAVQELHAYAIWWATLSEEARRHLENMPVADQIDSLYYSLCAANDRVVRLRKLESFLKGEGNG